MTPDALIALIARLDAAFPPCGPCAMCGGPDKRHRVWDAIEEQRDAGDSVETLARQFGVTPGSIRDVLAWRRLNAEERVEALAIMESEV